MGKIEFERFAIVWNEQGRPHKIDAKRVAHSGRKIVPDPRVIAEARKRMRELEKDSDSPNTDAA